MTNTLNQNKHGLYIGLMSGTSADGMDAVLCEYTGTAFRTMACESLDYSPSETRWLRDAALAPTLAVSEIMLMDRFIAERSVELVQTLLEQTQLKPNGICAVGSHGHTLRHQSQPDGVTWQIGDPSWIAEHTGICCVADFRRRDVAAGGQGAPLVPAFHQQVFGGSDIDTMALNIGGIANISVLKGADTLGFDTGPGNALMDEYCQTRLQQSCDMGGQLAATGKVADEVLQQWLTLDFLHQTPPKSTGRELFRLSAFEDDLQTLSAADALATLTEFTARSIADAVNRYGHPQGELLVCGGGAFNQHLMNRLAALLPHHQVMDTEQRGIHPLWVEGAAFAWLAAQTLNGLAGNLPAVTGARGDRILGAVYPA